MEQLDSETHLLEPPGASPARPLLGREADHEARPPHPVDRVRQVADVEQDDRRVDVLRRARGERVLAREAVHEPERDGHEQAEEDREGDEPVRLAVREELLAERAHGYGARVVLLDDPSGPLEESEMVRWRQRGRCGEGDVLYGCRRDLSGLHGCS